jgi:group I intron endonuclease
LEILEYCDIEDVLKREQYYLDLLKPSYNISPTAGSPRGYKHTEEAKLKMSIAWAKRTNPCSKERNEKISLALKGKIRPQEIIEKIRQGALGRKHTIDSIAKLRISCGKAVNVLNIESGETVEYNSMSHVAREFNTSPTTIRSYLTKQKLFKGIYLIQYKPNKPL